MPLVKHLLGKKHTKVADCPCRVFVLSSEGDACSLVYRPHTLCLAGCDGPFEALVRKRGGKVASRNG